MAALLALNSLSLNIGRAAVPTQRAATPSMAVGLLFSTTTGNTENVAGYVAAKTGLEAQDIGDLDGAAVAAFDGTHAVAQTRGLLALCSVLLARRTSLCSDLPDASEPSRAKA